MNASTALAHAVLDGLVDDGVTDIVLAPGSRNAPLAFAAYDADAAGLLRLHTRSDERTAGFLALGLTKMGRRTAVMCTSGTAVANLLPAVMEAAHVGLPLIVVTADRPARLRGTGASQTTDQRTVFGRFAQSFDIDHPDNAVPAIARGGRQQPPDGWIGEVSDVWHLNVQFDLPLTPSSPYVRAAGVPTATAVGRCQLPAPVTADAPVLAQGPRTVVVAGDDAGMRARQVAEAGGWPLFAEPTSGSRTGSHALRTYRLLLDTDLGRRIERVVVFGHPTLSRPIAQLLVRPDIEVISVRSPGIWPERPFPATEYAAVWAAEAPAEPGWLDAWRELDCATAGAVDRLVGAEPGLTPYQVAASVHAAIGRGELLVVGASSPIRDLDIMARPGPVGGRRKVIANRGLAGIDGTVSTAIGAALARQHEGRTIALMGDVTFLHDSGALVIGPREPRPDLTIVVVNDDGGSIFTMLEQGAPEYADRYDRLFGTPHGVDIAALCAATRTPHWKVESLPELEQALASPNGGIDVIEVRVRRDNRRVLDATIRDLVTKPDPSAGQT
ncbi:2-succinyl-5-enolpyruvyl-6-hydroxy-3-cyclohexene-1-carboxylic-acid synthase [Nocardioides cavernaquae]|uniref:2-succinyl-5-enolpyruvyl-6-hydroxy-3-cyclohexene-1-carboxylate synthase n=1 Tax=Nocardioides cavernaquae TaxID=2321396 RepID=A0A3A5H6G0_9ACTN|nr:2-succinyl-5-enolpyruvyl-6-hydroxy-3-cyclohexene-1-carboxylic-acid synthase [Nocardioides cavernaquae]RJS46132.1 2-succinyl-5-enolpyruvyl-6-hydroxy-3-cyclohexene-1-carboxylic-acid synthase [Nocardioides cavernaquae]